MMPEVLKRLMNSPVYKRHDNQHVAFTVMYVNGHASSTPRLVKKPEYMDMPIDEVKNIGGGVTKEELLEYFVSGPCMLVAYEELHMVTGVELDGSRAMYHRGGSDENSTQSFCHMALAIDTKFAI